VISSIGVLQEWLLEMLHNIFCFSPCEVAQSALLAHNFDMPNKEPASRSLVAEILSFENEIPSSSNRSFGRLKAHRGSDVVDTKKLSDGGSWERRY
jgi:hypothetical protein